MSAPVQDDEPESPNKGAACLRYMMKGYRQMRGLFNMYDEPQKGVFETYDEPELPNEGAWLR